MTSKLVMVFGLGVLGTALPVPGAEGPKETGPKQSFEVTSTERAPFSPGGIIRLNGSYGYLTVEGWDQPEVEMTVIKSTDSFYEPGQKEQALERLGRLRVVMKRQSNTELAITTILPARHSAFAPPLPRTTKAGVTLEYQIHVPRNSRLAIHNDTGYVWVSDVTGDLEVNSHTGDMIVMLPDSGSYSIDARTRLGSVSSDFVGKGRNQFVVGMGFAYTNEAPSRRIYLRMGRGCITIKKGPLSAPFGKS
jgi:hypothetical protein